MATNSVHPQKRGGAPNCPQSPRWPPNTHDPAATFSVAGELPRRSALIAVVKPRFPGRGDGRIPAHDIYKGTQQGIHKQEG